MTLNLAVRNTLVVLALLCQAAGSAWAGTEQRIFYQYDASNGLADNSAQCIRCTKTGRMVISTIGHVNFYDGYSFTHIDPKVSDGYPLPMYHGEWRMCFDRFHHLWVKNQGMTTCVDLLTERFIGNVDSVFQAMGVGQHVDDVFTDTDSRLWLLAGGRLHDVDEGHTVPVWQYAPLQDVESYGDKLLQFYSNGQVAVGNRADGRLVYQLEAFDKNDAAGYGVSSELCACQGGFFQLRNGSQGGVLLRLDVDKRQYRRLLTVPYQLHCMTLKGDSLYIGTDHGYMVYDIAAGRQEQAEVLALSRQRRLDARVQAIEFDRQGGMWVGTSMRGLLYAKPYASPFRIYDLGDEQAAGYLALMDRDEHLLFRQFPPQVNCILRDSRGWQWTGTFTGLKLDIPGSTASRVFTRRDGLMNEVVHSIVEDDQHDIWVGSSYGISHLFVRDGEVWHVESYNNYDDVPRESFLNGRALKLADGTIVMQSLDHVVAFQPREFHANLGSKMPLYPKLVRLFVNGNDVEAGKEVGGHVILDRAITRAREVSVNYYQNSLTLTFTGLNYYRPLQTYYRFRLKGVYDNWQVMSSTSAGGLVDSRGMLHLPLVGLKPGKYVLEMQASMSPAEWPVEPLTWTINVQQPWWRTTGVYLLLLLMLLVLAVANFIFFNRNLRLRLLRNNEEEDILKRVMVFVGRCNSLSEEVLTPYSVQGSEEGEEGAMSPEFIDAMQKIVVKVNDSNGRRLSMRDLAAAAGVEQQHLLGLMSANLYMNPRPMAIRLRLEQAAKTLRESDMSVEEVADRHGFVSPNFFIASFYHHYRTTPKDYRSSMAL